MSDHCWEWRRRRSDDFGRWECLACGLKTGRVPLDEHGRASLSGDEALERGCVPPRPKGT